jgi:hypothetical protein
MEILQKFSKTRCLAVLVGAGRVSGKAFGIPDGTNARL